MVIQWMVHSDCKGVKWALLPSHYQKNDQIIDLKLKYVLLWWNPARPFNIPKDYVSPEQANFHEDCKTIGIFIKLRYFSSPRSSLVGTEPEAVTNMLLFLMTEKLQGSLKSGTYTFSLIYTAREIQYVLGVVSAWGRILLRIAEIVILALSG